MPELSSFFPYDMPLVLEHAVHTKVRRPKLKGRRQESE